MTISNVVKLGFAFLILCSGAVYLFLEKGVYTSSQHVFARKISSEDKYHFQIDLHNSSFFGCEVTGVEKECSCTSRVDVPFKIPPFGSKTLYFEMNPKNDEFETNLYFYTNPPTKPIAVRVSIGYPKKS